MDLISKAIKCSNCNSIPSSPVILPCEHNICVNHVSSGKPIQCGRCGLEHPIPANGRFPSNEPLADIILSQIGTLDFGQRHTDAKNACLKLENQISKFELTLTDPNNFIYETTKRPTKWSPKM